MTDRCIRCGVRPADPACDWLHCAERFPLVCDEVHMALAGLENAAEPEDEDTLYASDLLAANDATDDECGF